MNIMRVSYLFLRHRVLHQRQVFQPRQSTQRIQVPELLDPVLGEYDCGDIWDRLCDPRVDPRDPVVCEEEGF